MRHFHAWLFVFLRYMTRNHFEGLAKNATLRPLNVILRIVGSLKNNEMTLIRT